MALKYKVTRSFFSASQQHFNENELVDPSVYHNQTATDQGNFILVQASDQPPPPPPAQNLASVKEAPSGAAAPPLTDVVSAAASKTASAVHQVLTEAHETFWQKVEVQFDAWKRDMTSEWDKIKEGIVQFFAGKEGTVAPGAIPGAAGTATEGNAGAVEGTPSAETGAAGEAAPAGQGQAEAGQTAQQQPPEAAAPAAKTTLGSQTT
jgi:hypothetical protein